MLVEEIPADQVVEMTDLLHRAFRAGGCNPICHVCCKELVVGSSFHLATVHTAPAPAFTNSVNSGVDAYIPDNCVTREVMLCPDHQAADVDRMTRKQQRAYKDYRKHGGGCHRVNGQIVH